MASAAAALGAGVDDVEGVGEEAPGEDGIEDVFDGGFTRVGDAGEVHHLVDFDDHVEVEGGLTDDVIPVGEVLGEGLGAGLGAGSGKWEVGSGKWEVGSGIFFMSFHESGKWEVGSGKWEVGSGKREAGSGIFFMSFRETKTSWYS